MTSHTNGTKKENDHSASAPKLARGSTHEFSPDIAEGEFPESVPEESLVSARAQRSLDPTLLREARLGRWPRRPLAESELPEDSERPLSEREQLRIRRSLNPDIVKEPPPGPRVLARLAALSGLVIVALIGAAIALFITGKFPSEWNEALGLNKDKTAFTSRFRGDDLKIPQQPSSPAAGRLAAAADLRPVDEGASRVAVASGASERSQTIRGVTDNEIRFGMSAPFTGPAKELGSQMKLGIETAFNLINDAGGVDGRQLRLVVADDGYEPMRTVEAMKQLYEKQEVFGFVGNVGTPTAAVAVPYALQRKMLFFGAFTGADLLRHDPPDRYVFNYRASYAEETDAVVRYLVKVRRVRPEQIAVFAQHDAYGDAGFAGVAKAIRALSGGDAGAILRLDYERNTVDVEDAVTRLRGQKTPIKAVVMVAAYRAAAKFIEKTRDLYPTMIYTNVSFVGSTALADELMLLGPRYANGVIVTQVVPAVDSYASAILKYRTALAKYFPGMPPDYVSLEGYVVGSVLEEGLKHAGAKLDTEKLVDGLEAVRDFDMGLGTLISFGSTEHQGSHKVWGTQLDEHGRYQPIDLQ